MKESALWLFEKLTQHTRRQLQEETPTLGEMPIGILAYHRVADRHPNDWTMSCGDFARQLDWLQDNYDIVSLEEAQRRVRAPFCNRPTVALTFDDGYSDNAEFAIPELARRNLPATYFVSPGFVRMGGAFPRDVEAGVALAPNTIDELRTFAKLGIEIGAHTRNHVDLEKVLDPSRAFDEIAGSVAELQRWLRGTVRYFAFPYGPTGRVTQLAVDVMRDLGMSGFCTEDGALNWSNGSGFHLRRIRAEMGLERLRDSLTFETRKLDETVELRLPEQAGLTHTPLILPSRAPGVWV